MPSNRRLAASQARKSASVSRVVEARGGGGLAGGTQSLRWLKIFSMIAASSMKLIYVELHIMQSIFGPAARRTILEHNGKISAATVG